MAGLAGLAIVIVCMLAYYKKAGLNATLALLLNSLILLAALAYLEAVLTLPGIAGIILSIGMAVDSNVLIFERIREELRAGKSGDCGRERRVQQGLSDHHRHARHDGGILRFPVPVRNRPGERLCGHAGDRSYCQRIYGCFRVEVHLRPRVSRASARYPTLASEAGSPVTAATC